MAYGPALRKHRGLLSLGALALGAAIVGVSLCPFATLTGVPCPGCGLLRATLVMLRGDVAGSLRVHPLAVVVVPTAAFAALRLRSGARMTRRAETVLTTFVAVLVVAMVAVWLARFRGAFGGPVSVNSIWNRGGPFPFRR